MVIRTAGDADVPAVTAIINTAFLEAERFFIDGDRIDEPEVRRLQGDGAFLIASEAGEDLGCVYVSPRGDTAYLGLLSILPGRQAKGLGSSLLAAAEHWCAEAGCNAIDIRVVSLREELLPFYRQRGYVERGTEPFDGPSKLPCHFVLMRKTMA
jgi:GNAT superfamily N-acetyltransferase